MKIKSDILRQYQSVHIWTGIISGIVLFIGFYAGSLTMFKPAINAWAAPPSDTLSSINTAQFDSLIKQASMQYEEVKKGFNIFLNQKEHSPMTWYEKGSARELSLNDQLWHASLDEKNQLIAHKTNPSALAELIDQLHQTAGIAGKIGHEYLGVYILGIAAILYFLALISGVIFLLPSLAKTFFALRKNKSSSRFWLDAHNLVGITSLPFHLVISLSVVVFAFHDPLYGSLKLAVYQEQPLFPAQKHTKITYDISQLQPVSSLINQAQNFAPSHQVIDMTFMNLNNPRAMLRLGMYDKGGLMRGPITDYIYMNPYNLKITNSSLDPSDEGIWTRAVATFFALHFGSFGGDMGRWVYFLLGLGGAFLFYSGNLLWLEKRRKKFKKDNLLPTQTRACHLMASATIGICFGSVAAVSITMLAGKWLYPWVENINSIYLPVYYLIFLSLVAYAFIQGAAKSAIAIFKICAIATLAIPLTSIIAVLMPSLGLWSANSISTLGVDLVALAFGLCFIYGVIKMKKRALYGPIDSIWSLSSHIKKEVSFSCTEKIQ
ncbi:PepSY-associated TM helix domain-containing protein [Pseudoalteromonas denitrificans]|uniref:Uncharacterized iron-regulated membrane protein n=1 Tax=Pseudoalteromonas denitrificans DSM 6059 TaxID=1123010 RepID=A0A1I1S4L5_9GAMM|nr:PepSY-associated TM helix domain-containing protein [Pseudoalteromonas denitrificans]SFD41429.1 Uncharacterized iron-regulated membrane protein [Pseudoalteromonas denitrificans DSM 6059]